MSPSLVTTPNTIIWTGFKPVKLRLKIDLVSYPARAEGLVNMIIWTGF